MTDSITANRTERHLQFGIQACLVMIVALALLLGYLRSFGGEVVARGALAIGVGLLVGGIAGSWRNKAAETMFWSTIGGLFGCFVSLASASSRRWPPTWFAPRWVEHC